MTTAATPAERKREIRARLREQRRSLGPGDAPAAGRTLEALLRVDGVRTVLGYLATEGEIPVDGLLRSALRGGATVLLPRMRLDAALDLVELPHASGASDLSEIAAGRRPAGFTRGRGGIAEPGGPARDPGDLDLPALALVPAVALDRRGHRLGRGAGAYDRLLGRLRDLGWRTIAVCHAAHVLEDLPVEPHDQPVDAILTEQGLLEATVPPMHRRCP